MKSQMIKLIINNLIFIFALAALHSQVIYFGGKDKMTGGTVQLDSVKIINNTRYIDTIIYGNSFEIPWYTVIENEPNMIVNSSFSIDYYPTINSKNFMTFRIKPKSDLIFDIRIYNTLGTLISTYRQSLTNRIYDVEISEPLNYGVYFVIFEAGSTKQIIKFIKTDEESDNLYYNESHPFNSRLLFLYDSCTFIGYAKGYRGDTINAIPEEGINNEFQLVKLGDWEFNDWKIYLSSIRFWSNYRKYWYNGLPPNLERDSNINQDYYDTKELDFIKSDFDSYECWNNDTNKLKFKFSYCSHKDDYHCKDFMECNTDLNFYFNIDTINNIIKELIIEYSFYDITYTTYGGVYLNDSYKFILQNIPFNYNYDGSLIAEVKANDYQDVLKEYHNSYMFNNSEHTSFPIHTYMDWLKLNRINGDTFFRLVLSK